MRDILITLIIFGLLPFVLSRPHIGILTWSWLGYMNPHRLAYGFAYSSIPFSMIVALATVLSVMFTKEPRRFPVTPVTVVLILFVLWMSLTTAFALVPHNATMEWERVLKIQLMVFLTLLVMHSRERLHLLVWVIVASIGFYGAKGGVFTIATGGAHRVWGPPDTYIENNNQLALALCMILPLMYYLYVHTPQRWIKRGIALVALLSVFSVLSTYSRGGFMSLAVVGFFFWLKSNRKFLLAFLVIGTVAVAYNFLPEKWFERMNTISDYKEDSSVQGRFNAWGFAYNVAKDRPILGGGYRVFDPKMYLIYGPDPEDFKDAHSIYFEVLGEHGFVGLFLFLLLGLLAYNTGRYVMRKTRRVEEMRWAYDMATMTQVGIIGYFVGGVVSGVAYYDLYYHLVAILVLLKVLVVKHFKEQAAASAAAAVPAARR